MTGVKVKKTTEVVLTAAEAPETDIGMGLARLDPETVFALETRSGDVVEIIGKKATAAKVFPLEGKDAGKRILRVDGLVRRNSGVRIGEQVSIRKAEVFSAEQVRVAPIISEGHTVSFGQGIGEFIKSGLSGRPLLQGDVVIMPGIALIGGPMQFMVVATVPQGIVLVSEGTIVEVTEEPVREPEISELSSSEERFIVILHGLRDSLRDRLGMVATELAKLQGEDAQEARRIAMGIRGLLYDIEKVLRDKLR